MKGLSLSLTLLLATVLAFPGRAALAQPTGDVEVQVVQGPAPFTPPTYHGELKLRLTNHGPDAVGFMPSGPDTGVTMTIGNLPYRGLYGSAFIIHSIEGDAASSEFGVAAPPPPTETTALYYFRFPVLQPGESWDLTVHYGINIFGEELVPSGSFVATVRTGLLSDNVDPNLDNNTTSMTFNLAPPARVPTLDAAGLAVFALALVLAFAWVRRRSPLNLVPR